MAVGAPALLCFVLLHCVATSAARIPNIKLPSQRQGSSPDVPLNNRPLVGILSQPGAGYNHETNLSSDGGDDATSYIAASYVKFVESGGARAVPLLYDEPEASLRKVGLAVFLYLDLVSPNPRHERLLLLIFQGYFICFHLVGLLATEILCRQWNSDSWRWIQLGRHPLLPCFGEAV